MYLIGQQKLNDNLCVGEVPPLWDGWLTALHHLRKLGAPIQKVPVSCRQLRVMGQNQSSRSSSSSRVSQPYFISHHRAGLGLAGLFTLFTVLQTTPSTPESFPPSAGPSSCLTTWLWLISQTRNIITQSEVWLRLTSHERKGREIEAEARQWETNLTPSATTI